MAENLFAARRVNGALLIGRVQLGGPIQDHVEESFLTQAESFFDDIDEEIEYAGNYTPDRNQLLVTPLTDEAQILRNTLGQNAVAIPEIDLANFENEHIKGLFLGQPHPDGYRVLVQSFNLGQVLGRGWRIPLILRGNTFRQLEETAFELDRSLAFVIEGDRIKFRSFRKLRLVLDMTEVFQAATDPEVEAFAGHDSFHVNDAQGILASADEMARKLITSIRDSGVLNEYTPAELRAMARETELVLTLADGRIVLPENRRELKEVLRFLNDDRWIGRLTNRPYVTNSKIRPVANQ